MNNVLSFYRMNPDVIVPTYGTSLAACFDLRYCPTENSVKGYDEYNNEVVRSIDLNTRELVINPGERLLVPTGLILQIKKSEPTIESFADIMNKTVSLKQFSIRIYARSGMALKRGLVLANSEGIVDVDYQKEIFIILTNISKVTQTIPLNERIAQAEIVINESFTLSQVSNPPENYSERDGGFGSTGSVS